MTALAGHVLDGTCVFGQDSCRAIYEEEEKQQQPAAAAVASSNSSSSPCVSPHRTRQAVMYRIVILNER